MKIAFGSCSHQDHSLPIFYEVVNKKPEMFIFLGDCIYGDTMDMKLLRSRYEKLGSKKSYKHLLANTQVVATWDDHDYGMNDFYKDHPKKEESKQEFLRFFNEPKDSVRWKRKGVYTSYMKKLGEKTIQIILLDVRWSRDPQVRYNPQIHGRSGAFYKIDYVPHKDAKASILGAEQWRWLDRQLQKPADLRIIGSGSQFGVTFNGYESWANYPHEQKRMIDLIRKNKAEGVMFISGDVHYGEVSRYEVKGCYPLYDVTASGLSSKWHFATPNGNRVEGPIMENHFGLLTIDLEAKEPYVKTEIWDVKGNQRTEYTIPMKKLKLPKKKGVN